jgi:2'-5' RNA ligase
MPIRGATDRAALSAQLPLPGFDALARPFAADRARLPRAGDSRYSLFLAVVPRPDDSERLAKIGAALCRRHGFRAEPMPAERLHVTLHTLGDFHGWVPQEAVDAAMAAGSAIACPRLPVVFDRLLSFAGSGAFVLRCDGRSDAGVSRLREPLAAATRRFGLRPAPSRTPHMTLLYEPRRSVPECDIEPIEWTADRFALILSHVGCAHHQRIREWTLG